MVLGPVRAPRGALTIRVEVHPGGVRGHLSKLPAPDSRENPLLSHQELPSTSRPNISRLT
jgi:hypothetical protein